MKTFFKVCGKVLSVCVFVATILHLLVLIDILREEREAAAAYDEAVSEEAENAAL